MPLHATSALRYSALAALIAAASLAAPTATAADLAVLPALNAAPAETSVSGISSGAFMAVQFGTAWSSTIKGVGVVSGGPYACVQAQASDAPGAALATAEGPCMKGPAPDLNQLFKAAAAKEASGGIDPLVNLARQKVYLFHGFNDAVVLRPVTDATESFYRHYMGDAAQGNFFCQATIGAGHSLVVLDHPEVQGLNACKDNKDPFIDQCGYDQAGILLQHIYGALKARNAGALTGTVRSFNQAIYMQGEKPEALNMGAEGYLFTPKDCEQGAACRVHIALHGCLQNADKIGRTFVDHTGYLNWADSNRIVVLFPQTLASAANPAACWDWWSYITHDDSYAAKSGKQIRVIKSMLDALTSGAKPQEASAPAAAGVAPLNVAVNDVADKSAALTWSAVPGAEMYRVSRIATDGAAALAGSVSTPGFADSGLAPSTSYRWRVSAVVGGTEGPTSSEVAATTRATPPACDTPGLCPNMQTRN